MRKRPCCRLSVSAAAVSRDDVDLGMISEPRLDGGDITVAQQRHDPPPLKVVDDRAVAVVAAQRPVIDADNARTIRLEADSPPHDPQQRAIADRHHRPLCKAGGRPAAERQPKMMNDALQSAGPSRSFGNHPVLEPFGEDPPSTQRCRADKASASKAELHLPARTGQIRDRSDVAAMNLARLPAAQRARPHFGSRTRTNTITPSLSAMLSTINPAGIKDDKCRLLAMVLIPPKNSATPASKIIKCESEPKLHADQGSPFNDDWRPVRTAKNRRTGQCSAISSFRRGAATRHGCMGTIEYCQC